MNNIITVKGLTKVFKCNFREKGGLIAAIQALFQRNYQLVTAVENINLNVEAGEIRALLGPNGAGKSTIIKLLTGILYPTAGEISVMGYVPWKQRVEYVKNIGVLFGQKGQLIWELPAVDTFLIFKEIYKIPGPKFKKNLNYLVELFQIGDVIRTPVRNLSLGERMKCEFVCTILHEPRLVFLDEPTIGMDVIAKDVVMDHIKKLNRERGVTFIFTSHDLSEIGNLCRKITIIYDGQVVFDDTVTNLRTNFATQKVIEIKFSREPNPSEIRKFNVKMISPLTGCIEITNENQQMQLELVQIINHLPVQDMNIYENSIEAMIKRIYRQKQKESSLVKVAE